MILINNSLKLMPSFFLNKINQLQMDTFIRESEIQQSALSKKILQSWKVNNTFATPYLQKPIDLGADVVLHSVTKFINGHADIVGGIIITKEKKLYEKIRHSMVYMGCNMDPHQAYMVLRGVKTLSLRIEHNQENALKVARFLERHPKISWVKYPGLESHPQFELAKKQMSGSGSMISFGVKGGLKAGRILMDSVHLAILAVSLEKVK